MHHAGVVYATDTELMVHGKKVKVDKHFMDRGETHTEGYVEPGDKDFKHLQHINFPYNPGDVLIIASEGEGTNKIEPIRSKQLEKLILGSSLNCGRYEIFALNTFFRHVSPSIWI